MTNMVNGEQKVKKKVVKVQHLTLTSMKPSQPSKQLYATRYSSWYIQKAGMCGLL